MKESKGTKRLFMIIIAIYLIIILFPFCWILITSFKPTSDIFGAGAYDIFVSNPTLEHYKMVAFEGGILRAVMNSFVVSSITTIYVVLVATLAAYVISRFDFKGKTILMGIILATSMFPQMITVGPVYNMFVKLGLTNSYAVVLPYSTITLPMSVWILVAHFNKIPLALEESATLDGATHLQFLFKVLMPLAAPGIFTTAIICFISAWNEFLITVTLNTNKAYHTVPVAISFLRTQFSILWGQVSAATIIVTIPTLIIVLLFQKKIISGLTSGALKE